MINNSARLINSPAQVSLVVGNNLPNPIASITTKLNLSVYSHTTYTNGTMVLPSEIQPTQESDYFDLEANIRELASHCKLTVLKDILEGLTPAYEITVGVKEKPTVKVEELPPLIESVLDSHSSPGGTLCRSIPPNTQMIGYVKSR